MKPSITIAAFAALFVLSSFALNANTHQQMAKNAKENVRREIIQNIACPDYVEGDYLTNQVKAIVDVDTEGHIRVEEINSANSRLIEYVKTQLQGMKVSSPALNQRFVLVINFKGA